MTYPDGTNLYHFPIPEPIPVARGVQFSDWSGLSNVPTLDAEACGVSLI